MEGCGKPVSCKGGSTEYIKKNNIIRDVASSLKNIEKHLGECMQGNDLGACDCMKMTPHVFPLSLTC